MQDNAKQLMVSLDKSYQEWAKLYIDAAKEGVELPPRPDIKELLQVAASIIKSDLAGNAAAPAGTPAVPNGKGPAAMTPNEAQNIM